MVSTMFLWSKKLSLQEARKLLNFSKKQKIKSINIKKINFQYTDTTLSVFTVVAKCKCITDKVTTIKKRFETCKI